MTDHRLLTIRFWLLCAAVLAACAIWQESAVYFIAFHAWTPLGLFRPIFPPACGRCTSSPAAQYSILVQGMANAVGGLCDCPGDFNGTYILSESPYLAGATAGCVFRATFDTCKCIGPAEEATDQRLAVNGIYLEFIVLGVSTYSRVAFTRFYTPNPGGDCHHLPEGGGGTFDHIFIYDKTFAGGADCGSLSSESYPINAVFAASSHCNAQVGTGAAEVTAI